MAPRFDDRQDRPDHRRHRRDRQGGGDRLLPALGARVGITGRDRARAERAAARRSPASRAMPAVDVFVADMSSQAEVRRLADEVLAAYPRLDVLLNNVGGFWAHRHVTADGLEHTFALNHLAPFLLTNLLLDRLNASAPARIVTVSSGAQSMGKIDFDDLMGERKYSGQRAYNQSKLANVMFTYELARRLEGTGVTRDRAASRHHQHGVRRRGHGARLGPDHRLDAPVHEEPGTGRAHVRLSGQLPGGGRCHRPVLRRSQGQGVAQVVLRHRDHRPTLAGQRRLVGLPDRRSDADRGVIAPKRKLALRGQVHGDPVRHRPQHRPERSRLRRVPRDQRLVVPPAPVRDVRSHRMLRLLAVSTRQSSRARHAASARAQATSPAKTGSGTTRPSSSARGRRSPRRSTTPLTNPCPALRVECRPIGSNS